MASNQEKALVRERARFRCEYCRAREEITGYAFHIEHILPRDAGGSDELDNYALCCMPCNRAKSNHLTGDDPQTGKQARLFNPRTDDWLKHFRIEQKRFVRGKTPIGRATETRLRMNQKRQLEARELWRQLDLYP